jgi:hypothetical protein
LLTALEPRVSTRYHRSTRFECTNTSLMALECSATRGPNRIPPSNQEPRHQHHKDDQEQHAFH